jgi:hypothetical protein
VAHACNPQKAEIRKIEVQSQPRQIVCKTLSQQKRVGGVIQSVGHEFKTPVPQTNKQKKQASSKAGCPGRVSLA